MMQCRRSSLHCAKSQYPKRNDYPFDLQYRTTSELGEGHFGKVYAGYRIADERPVAIKCIPKSTISSWDLVHGRDRVPSEIYLLRVLSHVPGVIRLLEWFETSESFLIIMEKPPHVVDLFDYISHNHHLSEEESRNFFKQVVKVLLECHSAGVIHRDIKDENLLVTTDDQGRKVLKLIDFGSAARLYRNSDIYRDVSGTTPEYSPPECLRLSIYMAGPATVWSLGILLYDMVFGNIPFRTQDEIVQAHLRFDPNLASSVSDECKDLIMRCLRLRPVDRPSLEDLLEHPWMLQHDDVPSPA